MHEQSFVPQGYCYLWNSDLIRLTVITGSLVAAVYDSIPVPRPIEQLRAICRNPLRTSIEELL